MSAECERSCCDKLSLLLRKIDCNSYIQYSTIQRTYENEAGHYLSHQLQCIDNNGDVMFFWDNIQFEKLICDKCVLQFYIRSNYYDHIWKMKINDKYYFQLSALMDLIGPSRHFLMMKRYTESKKLFKTFLRYNCYRLFSFGKANDLYSNCTQRLYAVRVLLTLLLTANKSHHFQWITGNKKNMNCINNILSIYFEGENPGKDWDFWELGDQYLALIQVIICRYSEKLSLQMINNYNNLENLDKKHNMKVLRKLWSKKSQQVNRGFKCMISCSNILCKKKSYSNHKYGITSKQYIERKKKELMIRKNKWYICKGCQCIYYCCRKCQKIAWKKQSHKVFCNQIDA